MLRRPPAARRRRAVPALAGLAIAWAALAGPAEAQAPESTRYRVFLWTMGQGDEIWELFGHNALVVQDLESGEALVWNWGLFDFSADDFLPRFLRGTMRYWMGPDDPARFLQLYRQANRTVYSNEVLLSDEQAAELDAFIRWNYLPENRFYTYDYYRDNCSTRVRDALNGVLDGALLDHFHSRETGRSYRWHSRRLVQGSWWVDQGLSVLLGLRGDLPRTEWEEMFLPLDMLRHMEGFHVEDGAGGSRPLLGPREVLFQADRAPEPAEPPGLSPLIVAVGLLGGGLVGLLGRWAGGGGVVGRAALGVGALAWALLSGFLGWILLLAWLTDHEFIHWNVNVFYLNPLTPLALGLLAAALLRRRWAGGWTGRWAVVLTAAIALATLAAALVEASRLVRQGNGEVLVVALPLNLAFALAAWEVHRRAAVNGAARRPRHAAGAVRVRAGA